MLNEKQMLYGAAYYPEHWDRKLWARDVQLMKQAGFNMVRLAEFAWVYLEPQEGVFTFDWLDESLDLLDKAGIRAILGTPTATIPAWMAKTYPHVMAMDENGHRRRFGVRKDYCVHQEDFLRLSLRVVEEMAKRYARDRRVIGFQTDNEFGGGPCRCPDCLKQFRAFLQRRYRTIEKLNQEYGTWFWGTRYGSFDEIDWPPGAPNPSLALDAKRYYSHVDVAYQAKQVEILRRYSKKPICHNTMGLYAGINSYDLTRDLDFISWDNYPGVETAGGMGQTAFAHAVTWSLKRQSFLVMEQQSGAGGWDAFGPTPAPGEMRMLAWQAVARGADGISYFRWRTSVSGQEQYWHGIINHDNKPRRRYREVAQTGKQLAELSGELLGTQPAAQVGVYYNYDQIWATEIQRQNGDTPLSFLWTGSNVFRALLPLGVDAGVFTDGQDLRSYKLIVCPPLYLSDPKLVRQLTDYVRGGGNLLLSARTGVKSINNLNLMQSLPGPFAALAGVEVDEYSIIPKDAKWEIEIPEARIAIQQMREHVMPRKGTQAIGVHRGGYMDGWPALTRRVVGKGSVWYVGGLPSIEGWGMLFKRILPEAGVAPRSTELPFGVEMARRRGKGRELTFVLNHTSQTKTITLDEPATDLLAGKDVEGTLTLGSFGVAVLRKRK